MSSETLESGQRMSAEVQAILRGATVEGFTVKLNCPTVDRSLYEAINAALLRIGGKWKTNKGHVFPFDPAPLLAGMVGSGILPPKNPLAFFPTPPEVISDMLGKAPICGSWAHGCRFLEPSAGDGAIANAICEESFQDSSEIAMDLVEVDPFRASVLRGQGYRNVYEQDFMQFNPGAVYHYCFMNSPFSTKGDPLAYVAHVMHAYDLLLPGGDLVAIVPAAWTTRQDARCRAFQDFMRAGYRFDLPIGAFKSSGTAVNTEIVYITKPEDNTQ